MQKLYFVVCDGNRTSGRLTITISTMRILFAILFDFEGTVANVNVGGINRRTICRNRGRKEDAPHLDSFF